MSLKSIKAENMFITLSNLAGYENLAGSYDKQQLLTTLNIVDPSALPHIEKARAEKGKQTRWDLLPSSRIIDLVGGLDCILSPNGRDKWGFDVTTDVTQITKKINKLSTFSNRWKALGITKVAIVLLIIPDDFEGMVFLDDEQKEMLIDTFLEDVIYPMDDQTVQIRKYVFSI